MASGRFRPGLAAAVNTAYQTLNDPEKMGWVNFVLQEVQESFPFHVGEHRAWAPVTCNRATGGFAPCLQLAEKRKAAKKRGERIPEDLSQEQVCGGFGARPGGAANAEAGGARWAV